MAQLASAPRSGRGGRRFKSGYPDYSKFSRPIFQKESSNFMVSNSSTSLDIVKLPKTKRIFDLVFSGLILVLSLPVFFLVLAVIFGEHIIRGDFFAPLFYREIRISQGRPFGLIKFNVFRPKLIAEFNRTGKFIATKELEKNRAALLTVGYFIKQLYLDELPQLVNIIFGQLSLVGPRPVNLKVYQKSLARGITNKKVIKAGLTGNFQCRKGLTKKTDVELDREYINFCRNRRSWEIIWLDLKIILKTIRVILQARGI